MTSYRLSEIRDALRRLEQEPLYRDGVPYYPQPPKPTAPLISNKEEQNHVTIPATTDRR